MISLCLSKGKETFLNEECRIICFITFKERGKNECSVYCVDGKEHDPHTKFMVSFSPDVLNKFRKWCKVFVSVVIFLCVLYKYDFFFLF